MDIKAVMSAGDSLESKDIIKIHKEVKEVLSLSDTGKEYAEYGLPERKILEALEEEDSIRISDTVDKTGLKPKKKLILPLAGSLKRNGPPWIRVR